MFTHECCREEINFHDVTVRVNHGEFITNLFWKLTDGQQYFQLESCHPSHTNSSIIFSQPLRMRRICSKRSDLVANVRKLKHWLRERGNPEDMVNKKTKRAPETPSLGYSKTSEKSLLGSGRTLGQVVSIVVIIKQQRVYIKILLQQQVIVNTKMFCWIIKVWDIQWKVPKVKIQSKNHSIGNCEINKIFVALMIKYIS